MLVSQAIELFYLFFEGIMLFQVIFFGMIYFISKRKDVLYYSLLNLISGIYFFLNAPDTFLGINEDVVFNSPVYLYVNFAIFLAMIFTYLVFLREIFSDTCLQYNYVRKIYSVTFYSIPALYLLFVLFAYSGWPTNIIFYTGHLINGPFCTVILLLNFRQKGYRKLIIYGMIVIFICVNITVGLTMRYNAGNNATVFDKYPLAIIKIGMLIDILLFQLALLRRWNEQEKQLAIEKLQSQLEVEKFRNKISAELHDDIGSTLSGISMYSHMADGLLQSNDYSKAKDAVNVIKKSANDIVHKLGDLVWAINPDKDSMEKMLERIEQYGIEMCRAKNIQFHFSYNLNNLRKEPGMDVRQHIFLLVKEAINNAVKYSGALVIKFEAILENEVLKISVTDNGTGFNRSDTANGNGLGNMQKRADAVGAVLSIQSPVGEGTAVELMIKITH
jgi:signal transduction histidine kinase